MTAQSFYVIFLILSTTIFIHSQYFENEPRYSILLHNFLFQTYLKKKLSIVYLKSNIKLMFPHFFYLILI